MERPPARISLVIRNVGWVGIAAHTGYIPLFLWLGHPALAAFNILSVATWIAAILANRSHRSTLAMWLLVTEVGVHAALATMTLGWESGFQYYLIPLTPFVMFNDKLGARAVWLTSGLVFAAFLALRVFAPVLPLDPRVGTLIVYSNLVIPFLALALVTYYFRLASVNAERRMEQLALTDPLTGLFNRRHMHRLLDEAQERFSRDGLPFCVIMADLDHFKQVNDQSGHDAGDRVLRAVATVFGQQLRVTDAVARWGGEEFLVLLSSTKPDTALDVAQRVRAAAEGQLRSLAELEQPVTLTLGIASFRPALDIAGLIKAADEALYTGKVAGRNRVVVGDAPLAATG
jgi:diguanylate cyclase (GGDEF)-like protein